MPLDPWRRNQYVMVATVFVVFTGFAFVLPFLPRYVRELGVPDPEEAAFWAGILIGVAPLLAGLLAPVWGRLADRFGQKRMAVRALSSYVVLLILSSLVSDVWQLLVLRTGIGLFGGIGPLGLSMATSAAPREQTGRAVGMVQAAQILSAAVGPFAGGFLADLIGVRLTFLVTALLCASALLLVVRYYHDEPRPVPDPRAPRGAAFRGILALPRVLPLLAVLFFVNFIGRSFTPILHLQLQQIGEPETRWSFLTGVLISAYSVAAALSATGLARAAGRVPPRLLLVGSLVGGAITVYPMSAAATFASFLALAVLLGLASGGALTLCYTMGGLMVGSDRRATAFGLFSGAALFGGALSPWVAGLLARWDFHGVYWLDGLLFSAMAVALLPGARRRAPANADPDASRTPAEVR
jgi:DHA1 family multidrug resistance protein-like MFS transporter